MTIPPTALAAPDETGAAPGAATQKPLILITGATGNLGQSIGRMLAADYRVVGLDRNTEGPDFPVIAVDLSNDASVELALRKVADEHGSRIASVIHLVAFFDFSGEPNPLYESVNVEGTRQLLKGLQALDVQQFLYASTMLVHAPCRPGERIDESQPIEPRWAYPQSKARAEEAIREAHGAIPTVILRLAGVYDEASSVPTLAQQMARIYERDLQSHLYAGSMLVGQAMLHRDDMLDAVQRAVRRRAELAPAAVMLIGEIDAIGYDALQDRLGALMHGSDDWQTLRVPKSVAAAGAWAQGRLEPVVPDAIDNGEPPFIRPFMVKMADDHYALDVSRARELLGWEPQHRLADELPAMVDNLKSDPPAWYRRNGMTAPPWIEEAADIGLDVERLRARHERQLKAEHGANRWAHFVNIGLGSWLVTQPLLIGVPEPMLRIGEIVCGLLLMLCAGLALSWQLRWARWLCAGIGSVVMTLPFLFSTANGAAYLSDTLIGGLIFGFAVCTKPEPGVSAIAALHGPAVPPGWSYNPSNWTQRIPIVVLAIVGLYVSRYLAGYQLGYIPAVWDPFFVGNPADPKNGTEEIVTSFVSEAWPVSDAAVGGYTYLLEIVTGIAGSRLRWRTMPWLVVLFGLMIAPLGITSISFIVIQPILIGTWSTIALIGAAAVLIQIPYSLDELVATLQFLRRRKRAGRSVLRVFFFGDTDETPRAAVRKAAKAGKEEPDDVFDQRPGVVVADMLGGGVGLSWGLGLAVLLGLLLLFTRPLLGVDGSVANAHHLIGALVLTVVSLAAAEVARTLRFLILPLGAALLAVPLVWPAGAAAAVFAVVTGLLLIVACLPRGAIWRSYGSWDSLIR